MKSCSDTTRRLSLVAMMLMAWPSMLTAQGFGVYEQGTCVMARAGTGVAAPCADGSSIYFNPAGIAAATTRQAAVGATGITLTGSFTNDFTNATTDLNSSVIAVPHTYAVTPIGDRFAAGIGVFVPYGLTTEWPETFDGRFLGYRSHIQGIYVQPTVAYRAAPWLRVGAGIDFSFYKVNLRQRVDLSEQNTPTPGVTFAMLGIPAHTDFADVNLEGSGNEIGGHFGVQVMPLPTLTLGARYLLKQDVQFNDATATISQVSTNFRLAEGNPFGVPGGTPLDALLATQFSGNGPLQNQGGNTSISMPAQLVLGLAWKPVDRATLLVDFQYTDWTVFDTLAINLDNLGTTSIPENYRRAYTYRFGGEYLIAPPTTLRAGFYFHDGAAPPETVTPNLPEGNRSSVTIGIGHRFGGGLGIDASYQFINQGDRRGRTVEYDSTLAPDANTNGLYQLTGNLFGATLSYAF